MDACFLKPSANRVAVVLDNFHYSGKLVIPDRAQIRPTTGTVVACGEGTDFWQGKRVLWGMYSGTPIKFRGHEPWLILTQEEILAEVPTDDKLDDTFKPEVAL